MTQTLDVGLDIDNVLYPFVAEMAAWAERDRDLPAGHLAGDALSWEWYKHQWGWTAAEFLDAYARGFREILSRGEPVPGAREFVQHLAADGHRIHYITARTPPGITAEVAHGVTSDWLDTWGFPRATLTVSNDKTVVPTDLFLDDAPHNIEALTAAGHRCPLLWDQPHNQWFDAADPARRVHSWADVLEVIHAW